MTLRTMKVIVKITGIGENLEVIVLSQVNRYKFLY